MCKKRIRKRKLLYGGSGRYLYDGEYSVLFELDEGWTFTRFGQDSKVYGAVSLSGSTQSFRIAPDTQMEHMDAGATIPASLEVFVFADEHADGQKGAYDEGLAGVVISDYKLRDMLGQWQVYIIAAMRLLVIPIVAGFVLKLLGQDWLILPTLMVLAMPCGMNTIVFPKLIGQDCKPGAALAFITTLLCVVTIPICLMVFQISIG